MPPRCQPSGRPTASYSSWTGHVSVPAHANNCKHWAPNQQHFGLFDQQILHTCFTVHVEMDAHLWLSSDDVILDINVRIFSHTTLLWILIMLCRSWRMISLLSTPRWCMRQHVRVPQFSWTGGWRTRQNWSQPQCAWRRFAYESHITYTLPFQDLFELNCSWLWWASWISCGNHCISMISCSVQQRSS